jgi:hypothetical protein
MQTNDSAWMQPVLDVVKSTDPDLFAAIDSADWTVTVVDEPEDMEYLLPLLDFGNFMSLLFGLATADGVTVQDTPGVPPVLRGKTWLNRLQINDRADSLGVPAAHFAAETLVHEWTHHAGAHTEPPAYAAGIKFSREAGDAAIAEEMARTLAEVQEGADHG